MAWILRKVCCVVAVVTMLGLLSGAPLGARSNMRQAAVDDLSNHVGEMRTACAVVTGVRKVKKVTYLDFNWPSPQSLSVAIELVPDDGFDVVVRKRAPGLRICADGRVLKETTGFVLKVEDERGLRSAVLPTARPAGWFAEAAADTTTGKPPAGLVLPRERRFTEPHYTSAAMRARVVGMVELECVVLADGHTGSCRVTKSLDALYGLDDQAMDAIKAWTFEPARKDGQPIAVIVTLDVTFRLH